MMRSTLIYVCLFVSTTLWSNDSIDHILNNRSLTPQQKLDSLIPLGMEALYSSIELAEYVALHSLELAERIDTDYARSRSLNLQGYVETYTGNYNSARQYFLKSLNHAQQMKDIQWIARNESDLGAVLFYLDSLEPSINYFFKSLQKQELLKDTMGLRENYGNLAVLHDELRHDSLAVHYFNKAIEINEALRDTINLLIAYSNLSAFFYRKNNFSKSLEINYTIIPLAQQTNNLRSLCYAYLQLAEIYMAKDFAQLDSASYYYEKAQVLAEKTKNASVKNSITFGMGKIYFQKQLYEKAIENFKFSLDSETSSIRMRLEIHHLMSKALQALDLFQESLHHLEQYVYLKDSLDNSYESTSLDSLQIAFDRELQLRKKLEEERIQAARTFRKNLLIYILTAIVIIGLIFLFFQIQHWSLPEVIGEGLLFVSILLIFQLILLFLTPHFADFTDQSPLNRMFYNILIAILLAPFNRRLTNLIKSRAQNHKSD